jgi:RNA polymerase sigma factor (sigma-70 family)
MRDSEVVASIVTRDPEGLAAAYHRYAARIFSFCRSQLGEPADAVGAVQNTFIIAASAVSELHDPTRLRPWLYAVARNEVQRRLRAGERPAALGERSGLDPLAADDVYDGARAQPHDLVRAAILSLVPGDQEIVELSLRHRLQGADLADVLGVPRQDVAALVARGRGQLESSLGALLVARVGRKACPELEQLVSGALGSTAARMHQQVNGHIAGCPVCAERKRQVLGPVLRLGFVPFAPIPPDLRDQLLRLATDASPAATAQRDAIVQQAGAFGAQGFPVPLPAVTGTGSRRRFSPRPVAAMAGAGTAAAAAVAAVLILVVPQGSHPSASALPANLSSPIRSAVPGGQVVLPTAPAGTTSQAPASGPRGKVPVVRIESGFGEDRPATGALAIQAGSLYAVSGTQATVGSGQTTTHSPARKSSPAKVTKSTPPVKTVAPIVSTSPTPVLSPTPTVSPTPTDSPTPVTSPTPPDSPPAVSSSAPTDGATISVTVGDLLSASVSLGG